MIETAPDLLRLTLADCLTWRALCGASSQKDALARIYHNALPSPPPPRLVHTLDELEALRPFALLWLSEQSLTLDRIADGTWSTSGVVSGLFARNVPADLRADPGALSVDWIDTIGVMVSELLTLAGRPGYLDCCRVALDYCARQPPELVATQGDCELALLTFHWGNA